MENLFKNSEPLRHYFNRLEASAVCRCLLAFVLLFGSVANGTNADDRVEVIKTDLDRSNVSYNRIDSENIELTLSAGLLAIEDFASGFAWSFRAAYHLNERLFLEASYTDSEGDLTTFEELSTGSTLITSDQRNYRSWDASLGLNIFPGETWIFGRAYSSDIYTVLGAGRTDFGGSSWTTINVGAGYRFYLTDWIALKADLRDHIFNRNIFGEDDQTHNIEMALGVSVFF